MINGIDVSMWQGNVDFSRVSAQGFEIVYIKATEGTTIVDSKFEQNYKNAKANGMKIGVYHFYKSNLDPVAQANLLYTKIKDKSLDCKIAIDVETINGVTPDRLSKNVCTFAEKITALTGLDVVIYTYTSFANSSLTRMLAKYPVWIAEYGSRSPKSNVIWGNSYVGWQYSSTGRVNGSGSASTDLDYFTADIYLSSRDNSADEPIVKPTQPVNSKGLKIGDKVQIIGAKYATGQKIPDWVKGSSYTVGAISTDRVLLKEIQSWVYSGDVKIAGENKAPADKMKVYIVKSGDTLGEIASKYNTTVDKLVQTNKIKNPNAIYIGQKIIIA